MEYIQCPHCLNKYGVNDRMRQALGKQIRCKHCQEPFRIVISGTPDRPPAAAAEHTRPTKPELPATPLPEDLRQDTQTPAIVETTSPSTDHNAPQAVENKTHPVRMKKKLNTQFLIFVVLISILLCSGAGLFIYTRFPQWFGKNSDGPAHLIPEELVKPMNVFPTAPSGKQPAESRHQETDNNADKSLLEGPEQPSQSCKELAAGMWIRLHLLATTKLDTQLYMQLMDQGIEQPAELRKLCKDRFLASRITDAAKQELIPDWISHEVERHTHSHQTGGDSPSAPPPASAP